MLTTGASAFRDGDSLSLDVENARRLVGHFIPLSDFFPLYPGNRVRIVCIRNFAELT